MPIKINPDLKMDSFRNWHGINVLQFHNYLEKLIREVYDHDVQFTVPDIDENSQFISRMHRYLQYLFLIELEEAVSGLIKPGMLGIFSVKNIARMTDINTNTRSVYGEDFFEEYSYLLDRIQKLNRVNEYTVALKYYGVLERAEDDLGELDGIIEDTARIMEDVREMHIDPYIAQAVAQLENIS